jgi:glycerol-3-phosphate acyltransferase PlsY
MAGIALYMLALSAVIAFGVLGHHYPALLLIVSGLTACASFGLLRQQRWGWALSLAATFLLMLYQFYILVRLHQPSAGFMGALNLVLFLYLVRPEVMERLK